MQETEYFLILKH